MLLASTSQEGSTTSKSQANAKELPAVEFVETTTLINSDYQTEAYQLEDLFSEETTS